MTFLMHFGKCILYEVRDFPLFSCKIHCNNTHSSRAVVILA